MERTTYWGSVEVPDGYAGDTAVLHLCRSAAPVESLGWPTGCVFYAVHRYGYVTWHTDDVRLRGFLAGLREGYETGREHGVEEAQDTVGEWHRPVGR